MHTILICFARLGGKVWAVSLAVWTLNKSHWFVRQAARLSIRDVTWQQGAGLVVPLLIGWRLDSHHSLVTGTASWCQITVSWPYSPLHNSHTSLHHHQYPPLIILNLQHVSLLEMYLIIIKYLGMEYATNKYLRNNWTGIIVTYRRRKKSKIKINGNITRNVNNGFVVKTKCVKRKYQDSMLVNIS